MSTDFENTGLEKNAITGEKPVRRWKDSKSCIFGISDPIKPKLLETVLDAFYFHKKKKKNQKIEKNFLTDYAL